MEEPIKVPAIGFSITANIDGNRQVVFQGFFDEAETDKMVNGRIDRVMKLVDRQRAVYEIPALREEFQKLQDELDQYNEDVDKAESEFQKTQAALDVQALEARGMENKEFEEGLKDHTSRGKGGTYKPVGNRARNIDLIKEQIEKIRQQKQANEAERQQFLDNIRIAIERRKARAAILQEKIADLEASLT